MRLLVAAALVAFSSVLPGTTGAVEDAAPATVASRPPTVEGYLRFKVSLATNRYTTLSVPAPARIVNAAVVSQDDAVTKWDEQGLMLWVPEKGGDEARRAYATFEVLVADYPATPTATWGRNFGGSSAGTIIWDLADRSVPRELVVLPERSADRSVTVPLPSPVRALSPRAVAGRRTLLAHYVPWHWNGDYGRYYDRPLDPDAATSDPGYVGRSIDRARSGGIDGFVVTTWGLPHRALDVYMAEALERPGWRTAFQVNPRIANPTKDPRLGSDPGVLAGWMIDVLDAYHDHPSLLRTDDGRPVFFVYWARTLDLATWRSIRAAVEDAGHDVALIGEQVPPHAFDVFDGDYIYNTLVKDDLLAVNRRRAEVARTADLVRPGAERRLWVATVTPGLHDSNPNNRPRFYSREDGRLYDRQWRAALGSDPDWVLIVTWNDFQEGTAVEPSAKWGTSYLDSTRRWAQEFHAEPVAATSAPSVP